MNRSILITGANGQLGSEIHRIADARFNRWYFTDVEDLDITDAAAVSDYMRSREIDTVINCAAYTQVDRAEDEPDRAELINSNAVENLALACSRQQAVLIHISTDYVFGGTQNRPYLEDDILSPLGVYGKTKLAGEHSIAQSGCRSVIIRTSWLYSEFGNNFVKTMRRLTAERDTLNVVFDQVGTPTYAADLAGFIGSLITSDTDLEHTGVYHFSNEGVCSWYDFAQEIASLSGHYQCAIRPCRSEEFPSKVKRPAYSVLDKRKIKETFQIEIPYWRDSLIKCIDRIKEREDYEI